ncbi:MAG: hypothetical protein H7222_15690 [Methylotenera sp.]|nr:hypothetical protein [Oligoflexia bacterium]
MGQPISASSSLSSIQFTITYAYLRPYTATAASFLSSANCTGTWTAMTGQTVFGIACSYSTQPINGEKADNVVSKSGSTIALGGFSSNRSIPGVPENTTVSTTTRTFN